MSNQTADVVVIGMGPGGEDVAGKLAEAGLDVVGIDRELVGGECPYWGCIPSKMMIRAAHLLAEARRIPGMAGDATVMPDWAPVAQQGRQRGLHQARGGPDRDVLVGAIAMGPNGGEVLGLLTLAVHAEIPIPTPRQMIYAYPTLTTTIPMICSITWGPTEELGNQNNSLTMDGTGIEQHDVVLPGAEAGEEYFFTVLRTARFAALDGVTGQVVRFDVDSSSGGNTGAVEIRVLAPTG